MDVRNSNAHMQNIRSIIASAIESGIVQGPNASAVVMAIEQEAMATDISPAESLAIHVAITVSQAEADAAAAPSTVATSFLDSTCPTLHYRKAMGDTKCSICLCDFKPNRRVRRLPCGHLFCAVCISKWLVNESVTCPTCRRDVRE